LKKISKNAGTEKRECQCVKIAFDTVAALKSPTGSSGHAERTFLFEKGCDEWIPVASKTDITGTPSCLLQTSGAKNLRFAAR